MPNIKPISDLRNYASLLKEVSVGEPVYLTKNGRGAYAIVDIRDQEEYEKMRAKLWLLNEVQKGIASGDRDGWIREEEIRGRIHARGKNEK